MQNFHFFYDASSQWEAAAPSFRFPLESATRGIFVKDVDLI